MKFPDSAASSSILIGDGFNNLGSTLATQVRVGVNSGTNALDVIQAGSGNVFTAGSNSGAPGNFFVVSNAGNVGVGTTSPGALLAANGNILGNGTLALTGTSGTTTIAAGQGFTVGNSQLVVQQGSGNVGIGTTSPVSAFAIQSSSSGNNPQITLTSTTNGSSGVVFQNSMTNYRLMIDSVGGFELNDILHGRQAWYLDSSGHLGIGNYFQASNVPKNNLDVSAAASIGFGTSNVPTAPTNGLLVNGDVGIGTTTPDNKLTISGSTSDTAGSGLIHLDDSSGPVAGWSVRLSTAGGNSSSRDLSIDRDFSNTWSSAFLIQRSTGNVGIGTTTPDKLLTIATSSLYHLGIDDSAIYFSRSVDNAYNASIGRDSNSTPGAVNLAYMVGAASHNFYRNGSLYASLGGGSVGVNSSSVFSVSAVSSLSALNGVANSPLTIFSDDASGGSNGIIFNRDNRTAAGNNAVTVWQYNGSELGRFTTGGNLGIGTTSPLGRLSVIGAGTGTGRTFVAADSNNDEHLTVLDNGNVLVNNTTFTYNSQQTTPSFNISPTINDFNPSVNTSYNLLNVSPSIALGTGGISGVLAKLIKFSPSFTATTTADIGSGTPDGAANLVYAGPSFNGLRNVAMNFFTAAPSFTGNSSSNSYLIGFYSNITATSSRFSGDYLQGFYSKIQYTGFLNTASDNVFASFHAANISSTGGATISTQYGLLLDDLSTATNNWGIFEAGKNAMNRFAATTSIGVSSVATSTWASAMLQVRGQNSTAGNALLVENGSASPLIVAQNAGNVGIGTTTPFAKFAISLNSGETYGGGNAFIIASSTANSTTTLFNVANTGNATLAGTLTQNSDQRLKANIQPLDGSSSLAAIDALAPVSYQWQGSIFGSGSQLGFIAQQVQQTFPQLVSTTSPTALTPGGTLGLNYTGLIAPMVAAIQTLSAEVASIEHTITGFADSFTTGDLTYTRANGVTTNTQTLCLTDGPNDQDPVCVTKAQLAALLAGSGSSQAAAAAASQDQSGPSSASDVPPEIQINGENPAVIQVGATYNDLGAMITGPQGDLNLGIETFVNGVATNPVEIDTTAAATDTIGYVVTDQNGLTSTSTRTVIVEALVPPPASSTIASSTEADSTSTAATSTAQ